MPFFLKVVSPFRSKRRFFAVKNRSHRQIFCVSG
nr:MAG TPA: hypothetical protein [Caudoviricetes sp.]